MKTDPEKFLTKPKKSAPAFGVDVFGIADMTSVKDFLSTEVKDLIKQFPKAISIGVRLSDAVVDQLYQPIYLRAPALWRGVLFQFSGTFHLKIPPHPNPLPSRERRLISITSSPHRGED